MIWKDKDVLVTGGCGMIGSVVARELVKQNAYVEIVDNLYRGSLKNVEDFTFRFTEKDLINPYVAEKCVKDKDVVFMFACILGGIDELMQIPATLSYKNIIVDLNTLEACRKVGVETVLFATRL